MKIKLVLSVTLLLAVAGVVLHALPTQAAITCPLPTTYGKASSSVNVATAGTQHVWSRIKVPDTTNNSYYFQADGNCAGALLIGDSASITPGSWVWVDYRDGTSTTKADISLTAGAHTIDLIGNEGGVQVDRVLLLSDSCVPTGTGANCEVVADTTAPTGVSLTAPASGATISATTSLTGTASDNIGVTKLEFYRGTTLLGSDTTSPYTYSWDTTTVANGSYSLSAKAYDAAGNNTSSSAVSVTVSNTVSPPPPPPGCDRNATTAATLATQAAAATAGQTICLATGSYGTWSGVSKAITITKQTGATPSIALNFANINGLTIDGLTITQADLNRNVKNVTVKNSTFTGFVYIDATDMLNGNILFDNNTHININLPEPVTGSTGREGRIHIGSGFAGGGTLGQNSGITVSNSLFSGGTSDGMRVDDDVAGVQILNNEFTLNSDQGRAEVHSDPIQFYGGKNVTVKGNYFHDFGGTASCSLGQHDGGSGDTIVNNLIVGGSGCYYGMYLRADQGSTVRHNTFVYGACSGGNCGILWIGAKAGTSSGGGTLYEDNIFTQFDQSDVAVSITARNNLTRQAVAGTGNITGTPTYVGGTGVGAYALASGLGKGTALNKDIGADIGANVATVGRNRASGGTTPTPPPPPPVLGDLDGDTHVTGHDLSLLLSKFNTSYPAYDLDNDLPDHIITGHDLSLLLGKYGT